MIEREGSLVNEGMASSPSGRTTLIIDESRVPPRYGESFFESASGSICAKEYDHAGFLKVAKATEVLKRELLQRTEHILTHGQGVFS